MRRAPNDTESGYVDRQSVGWKSKAERRPLGFELQVARVLRGVDDCILAIATAFELLHPGIEGVGPQFSKLGPVCIAVKFAEFVPHVVLYARDRGLHVDLIGPFWIERILPRLRR